MNISPQLRLSIGLISLLLSTLLVADFLGLMPRPEEQVRESRKVLSESLAVQLSSAASRARNDVIEDTIRQIVSRNEEITFAGLWTANGQQLAAFGTEDKDNTNLFALSSTELLVVPIFDKTREWGEVRLQFAPSADWGLRYIGIPARNIQFILFLCAGSMLSFFLLMRKALTELNPSKVVPQRVHAAFDVLAEGVVIMDEKLRIVLANQSFASRLGVEPEYLVGKSLDSYQWDLRGDDLETLPWQSAFDRGDNVQGMPLKLILDDEDIVFSVNSAPIDDGQGQIKGALVTFDDVTPLQAKNTELADMLTKLSKTQEIIQAKNQELQHLATRDPLTGCLNRRSFMEAYQLHYQKAQKKGANLTVLMIDIDHFKRVNDEFGHGVGDQAIKLLADILQSSFGKAGVVARYGGEEFVVSLPGTDLAKSLVLANRFCAAVPALVKKNNILLPKMSVSVGVASYTNSALSPEELLDQADRGLYQAKETGRNRVCPFDPNYSQDVAVTSQRNRTEAPMDTPDDLLHLNLVEELKDQLEAMEGLVKDQAEEITHRAMHDELTGLPNRFLLLDRLKQAMNLSARNDNLTAVVSVSLSAYEHVFGMEGGDAAEAMLKQASERLESVVRAVDTIGVAFNEQALTLSRIASNELAMLVVDIASIESIPKIIGRVTRALEDPFMCGSHEYQNKVHCGIAVYPHDGQEADALIRNATLARSFAERRSRLVSGNAYFSKSIDELSIKNAKMASALRGAIADDSLQIVYQPKVDAQTNRVTGVEALARWHHPELGHVGPLEFITVAEQIGVIDKLTDWVLARVCRDIRVGELGNLRVSVNVSPIELCDSHRGQQLLNIVQNSGISPEQIEVEIVESSVLNNFELTRTILSELQQAGIMVALDDFGTAYSSLNLLIEIPVDVIKIDRSFVAEIQNAAENRAVVQAIVQMAKSMGKRVVAEGVETQQELDCLISLGCREIQGYFFSRPVPYAELVDYVQVNGLATAATPVRRKTA